MQNIKDIKHIQDTFKIGYEKLESSRIEAKVVWELFHNYHYTEAQHAILNSRGQPAETFNIIKIYSRLLLGYYSTIINTVRVESTSEQTEANAAVLSDLIQYVLRDSNFKAEGEKVKLGGIISGILAVQIKVEPTGETDEFGRPHMEAKVEHVPEFELVLDPNSKLDDYSDAQYQHRFKWVDEDAISYLFGSDKIDKLDAYFNETLQDEAEYEQQNGEREIGRFKIYDKYQVVQSITKSLTGEVCETFWCGDVILKQRTYTEEDNGIVFPFRVIKINGMDTQEYYGIFREIVETQKAINQALIKLQQLVSTQKAFVETDAVEDLANFTDSFNRVSAVIPVTSLAGIKIENMSREAIQQYQIIDKALDRVQRTLGINDSFLGMAFASDSGRKVKLQQNAATIALRYFTGRIETFYKQLGYDLAKVIKTHYKSHLILKIVDPANGNKLIEVNKPEMFFDGGTDNQGQPILQPEFEPSIDSEGEHKTDEYGNFSYNPVTEPETTLNVSKIDINITTIAYDDEDEKNQQVVESIVNGPLGQTLIQHNPVGFYKIAALSVEALRTKSSSFISRILEDTSDMLAGNPEAQQQVSNIGAEMPGRLSQQGKQ